MNTCKSHLEDPMDVTVDQEILTLHTDMDAGIVICDDVMNLVDEKVFLLTLDRSTPSDGFLRGNPTKLKPIDNLAQTSCQLRPLHF